MKERMIALISAIFMSLAGSAFLFWPERLRDYAIKIWFDRGLERFNPFLSWMKTQNYILFLRIFGTLMLLIGLFFLIFVFFRRTGWH
jgi:hypothetical protein